MKDLKLDVTATLAVTITPNKEHGFVLPTKEVAKGYGVSENALRKHHKRHSDELLEGVHFIVAGTKSPHGVVFGKHYLWTKAGVITLGYFIKSEQAKMFRQWATALILEKLSKKLSTPMISMSEIKSRGVIPMTTGQVIGYVDFEGERWFKASQVAILLGYSQFNIHSFYEEEAIKLEPGFWFINKAGIEKKISNAQIKLHPVVLNSIFKDLLAPVPEAVPVPVPTMEDLEATIMELIQIENPALRTSLTQRFLALKGMGGMQ